MNRKVWIGSCLLVVFLLGVTLSAGAQDKKAGKKMPLGDGRVGLIFNATDLLLGVAESSDGVQFGLGMKYWLAEKMALRALLAFDYTSNSAADTSTTTFGLSGAFEYHFVKAKVSPYTGGLLGVEITTGDTSDLGFYLGGILGAEVRVLDYLGLFAEYNLRLTINEPTFDVELRMGNGAQIGVILYLP